jgi:N-acetylglucosamine-6-phosphate deacetylase
MVRLAVRAKGAGGVLAITDATAGAGLPLGATARLGAHEIHVRDGRAELADGTLAGSVLMMDEAFRMLIAQAGISVVEAARLCATTPAQALNRPDLGRLAVGLAADVVVLDQHFHVRQTWVDGIPAWNNGPPGAVSATEGRP